MSLIRYKSTKSRLIFIAGIGFLIITFTWLPPLLADSQVSSNNNSLSFVNFLAIVTTILGVAGGSVTIIAYIVKLTNIIRDLEKSLIVESTKTRNDISAELNATRDYINKINNKFEIALIEAESHQELISKDFVNLQKEVQVILRGFDVRLQNIENVLERKLDYKVRQPRLNENIEGL